MPEEAYNLDNYQQNYLKPGSRILYDANRLPIRPALSSHLRTAMNEIRPSYGRARIGTRSVETTEAREVLASLDGIECESR